MMLLAVLVGCNEPTILPPEPPPTPPVVNPGDDDDDDEKPDEVVYKAGFNFSPATINADAALTVTYRATSSSALNGYAGKVYAHTGVVTEGTWMFVPAEWNENLAQCEMKRIADNTWQLEMKPSVREWFASGETPVESLGFVIRSADGSLKGQDADFFVDVVDDKYEGFAVGEIVEQSMPANLRHGINVVDNSTVALVLYDKDNNGSSKDYAYVVGDFNDWTLANDASSQMYRDNAAGVWWIELHNLDGAREYAFQYYVGKDGEQPTRIGDAYCEKILDPYNDKYITSATYSDPMDYPEKGIGFVSVFRIQRDNYHWAHPNVVIEDKGDLVIYEILLRDFTTQGNLHGAMEKLDYIKSLGVNAIELMPVQEFEGNESWGYNPMFFFALDKAYGTRTMYKEFIDACHARGMAVIFDVVYNHATGAHPFARLYWDASKNKTAKNNPYFNVDAPHPYSVFHDFNHSSSLVRDYVKQNLAYLLEEYNVDGFRFDLTKGFTQRKCTEQTASNFDPERISVLKEYNEAIKAVNPDALVILEHFCTTNEESQLAGDGMMLWRNANHAFCQTAMGYGTDNDFSAITTYRHQMPQDAWVGYMESHDEERMGYKQQAYGKGLMKSDLAARMQQLGANAAFALLTPGPKMIWQFGEMGYDFSINSKPDGSVGSSGDRTGKKAIRWDYLDVPERKALHDDYASLLELRAAHPALFEQDAIKSWKVNTSYWSAGRYIHLESVAGEALFLAGNFTEAEIATSEELPGGNTWYDYATGEQVTSSTVSLKANDYRLFVNFNPR